MRLGSLTRPQLIFPNLEASGRDALLQALATGIAGAGEVTDPERLYQRLLEREELGSTGIGGGVAIPHCKYDDLDHVLLAVGLAPAGVDFDAADGAPVRLVFVVVAPEKTPTEHLKTLAAISHWVQEEGHVERILELQDTAEILALLDEDGSG